MTYWNYCDYRCEDCEHLYECPVALKEKEQQLRAIAEGREFDPFEAVKESFQEVKDMIMEKAEEMGIDLDSVEVEEPKKREFPLVEKTTNFTIDVMNFAKEVEDRLSSENTQKALHDLCWYAGLMGAKLHRALSGKYEAMEEDDLELKEIDMDDTHKTAKVVAMAISRCKEALDTLSVEYLSEVKSFYDGLKDIERDFRLEFPEINRSGHILH